MSARAIHATTFSPADRIVSELEAHGCRPRRCGSGMSFRCPAHEDRSASGTLDEGSDGRVLLHCHAGCSLDAIVAALGLTPRDLFADRVAGTMARPLIKHEAPPRPGRPEVGVRGIVAVYDYMNASGEVIYRVGRTADKQFPTAHVHPVHGWVWGHPAAEQKVLYNLVAVFDAVERDALVILTEGEKDADVLNVAFPDRIDYCATTKMGGANSACLPRYGEALKGARVLVIADQDEAGHKNAARTVAALLPVVQKVAVAVAAEGKDAADHVAAGFGIEDFEIVAGEWPSAPLRLVV